jgi:RNA polymerase sigma factor (sigma-70 family)
MEAIFSAEARMAERDRRISQAVALEGARLRGFIRRRVPDPGEAEDILQDVLLEFVQAIRMPEPIEQVAAWLFRVARNRIIDRFRRKREEPLPQAALQDEDSWLDGVLPASSDGPAAAYARKVLLEELQAALGELPPEQREVFLAHEIEGRSFKELAARTGVGVNTLLARKRRAVLHLRSRLQAIYDDSNW